MTMTRLVICFSLLCSCPETEPEPYSPCEAAGEACNGDGLCTVDTKGSICVPSCNDSNDCPAIAPMTECSLGYCFVFCEASKDCATGMICSIVKPEPLGMCVWPD